MAQLTTTEKTQFFNAIKKAAATPNEDDSMNIINSLLDSITVPIPASAAQQALSGAGAINVTSYYTAWTSTGADAGTLADGVRIGHKKKVQLIVDGGTSVLTPANLSGGTTITFADAGDFVILEWTAAGWLAVELGNGADGATSPVLA